MEFYSIFIFFAFKVCDETKEETKAAEKKHILKYSKMPF